MTATTPLRGYTYPLSTDHVRIYDHMQVLASAIDTDVSALITVPVHAQVVRTTASGTITTVETVTDTITVTVVAGKTYDVEFSGVWSSTVADDGALLRLREDTVAGTQMVATRVRLTTFYTGNGTLRSRWTAAASGSKTFVVTCQRSTGTGNVTGFADTGALALFTVDQVGF